jgi:hypothetical protein
MANHLFYRRPLPSQVKLKHGMTASVQVRFHQGSIMLCLSDISR